MNDDLRALDELGVEIRRMTRERRRRRRWGATLGAIVVAGGLGTGVALAAQALLEEGEPVSDPPGLTAAPTEGLGVTPPEDAKLLAVRVPDPDGGPPWGLQFAGTSRSFGCLQVGRVVGDRLGVLGQDGAFANDGRFHALPAQVRREQHCQPKDANGRTYVAVSVQGMPASGFGGSCMMRPQPKSVQRQLEKIRGRTGEPLPPLCAKDRVRIVLFGLLGPRARGIDYLDERGVRRTAPTAGPEGAYLIVMRPRGRAQGHFVTTPSPGSALKAIRYTHGKVCRIRSPRALGGAKACPRVGYEPRPAPRYDPAQLRAPVTAQVGDRSERPPAPPGVDVPRQRKVTIRFRAPVPGDATTYYFVTVANPRQGRGCTAGMMMGPIARDVAAGEVVTYDSYLPSGCRGTVRVTVRLHSNAGGEDQMPFSGGNPIRDPLVGESRTEVR
jgi:hypothetical protein